MILCVNLNAAIDKTLVVRKFRLGAIHRPEQVLALAGGKGFNVARALKSMSGHPVVTGWAGSHAGQFIEDRAATEGIETAFVHTRSESRTCLSILDLDNHMLTELYEEGDPISTAEIAEFVGWFESAVGQYDAVTFSGSMPPGVPRNLYAHLIDIAHATRVPTLLDAGGDALRLGIKARPSFVKVNRIEFQELIDRGLETIEDYEREAIALAVEYGTIVVVSLGAQGAICAQQGRVLLACPPAVNVVSAVGSGDSLLAGVALGLVQSLPLEDCLRQGVAAGTANAMRLGAGIFTEDDFRQVVANTTITVLHLPSRTLVP